MPKPTRDRITRAVIYVRQSTAKEESISLDEQERAGREHCARHGYSIVAVIADRDLSGRRWDNRKGVQQCLEMIEQKRTDVMVLWRWSRLARQRMHFAAANEKVETLGGRTESAMEPIDTTTAAGKLQRGMMGEWAAFQSDMIGEGWQDAHANRRRRGLPAIGGQRFGYRWIREPGEAERYEIHDEQASVLAWMYSAYIGGSGGPGLARELNRRGVLNARGGHWTGRGARDMLDSGFGAGLLRRIPVDANGTKIEVPFTELEWDNGAHPAIIDEETWRQYKRARIDRGVQHPRRINARYTLSGLVRCGDCGYAMTRRDRTRDPRQPYVQLVCRQGTDTGTTRMVTMSERRAIDAVKTWLAEVADDVGEAAEQARAAERAQLQARTDSDQAQRELDKLDQQLATLRRHLVAERMSEDEYDQTRAELLAEREQAAERLAVAEHAANEQHEPAHTIARGLLDEWDTLPVERRRSILASLVRKIVVTPPERPYGRAHAEIVPTWAPQ